MAIKFLQSVEVDGEVQGTSLDINGNADISGNLTLSGTYPRILFTDSNSDDDYSIINDNGTFIVYNDTDSSTAFAIAGNNNATFTGTGTFDTSLKINAPDGGGAPAMTAIMNMHGYEGRGVGIKMRDSVNSASSASNREWFVGTGYNTSGFNIGYAADGSSSSYAAQAKLSIGTNGNATFAGNVDFPNNKGLTWAGSHSVRVENNVLKMSASSGIQLQNNATFTGTIGSGAITSTGKITGTELEGTSLDINGNADISGNITSANWTGDVIGSAYLDSDTAHLGVAQTFTAMKSFEVPLTNSDDWASSPISILEKGNVNAAQSADKYAPNLNFHWGAVVSNSLWMGHNGHLNYGGYSSAGVPAADGTFNIGALTSTGKVTGTELEGTSLDINGNADISGNLTTGNGSIECGDLDVSGTITGDGSSIDSINAANIGSGTLAVGRGGTGLTSISTLLNSNVTSVSGSSGSCTGNAATATTATNANNVKTTSVSNSAEYFGVFVDANGTAYQDLHVGAGLKYNPSTDVLTSGKISSDTVSIVENAKTDAACMTITGAGAGNEANIALKIAGTAHGDPVKVKIKGENGDGNSVGKGLLSYDPDSDGFGIGQSSSHNQMAMIIDNSDIVAFKNMPTFPAGIDITGATDATNATGDTGMLRCEGGASIAKKLYVGSTITGSADVIAFSDRKLKDNIETLDGKKVLDMRGVSFTRKDTGAESSGVIAQEIQKVAPELVHDTEGTLGVAYGNLVGYLIEAVKDQQKQIDELKELCSGCSK